MEYNTQVRKVSSDEVELLQQIALTTFLDSFSSMNTEEDMQMYVEEHLSVDHLRKELENPDSQFYFALYQDEIIGYLKINFAAAQSDLKDQSALEIERIYVVKEFQGKQVAQSLYDKALEIAQKNSMKYIWLGVWEKNPRAIRFYEKLGFKQFNSHTFMLGNDKQTDLLMKLEIKNIEQRTKI